MFPENVSPSEPPRVCTIMGCPKQLMVNGPVWFPFGDMGIFFFFCSDSCIPLHRVENKCSYYIKDGRYGLLHFPLERIMGNIKINQGYMDILKAAL